MKKEKNYNEMAEQWKLFGLKCKIIDLISVKLICECDVIGIPQSLKTKMLNINKKISEFKSESETPLYSSFPTDFWKNGSDFINVFYGTGEIDLEIKVKQGHGNLTILNEIGIENKENG
jgi:hypothetical protein